LIRATTMLWLSIAAVMGAGLFYLKYDVQELERMLARLNGDIAEDERAIHVLTGEWSYLNQPDRLDDLSRRYLGLAPLARARIMTLTDLPPQFGAGGPKLPTAGPAAMSGKKGSR
jgi:hypothetical protein